jgi:hypothetical protein
VNIAIIKIDTQGLNKGPQKVALLSKQIQTGFGKGFLQNLLLARYWFSLVRFIKVSWNSFRIPFFIQLEIVLF